MDAELHTMKEMLRFLYRDVLKAPERQECYNAFNSRQRQIWVSLGRNYLEPLPSAPPPILPSVRPDRHSQHSPERNHPVHHHARQQELQLSGRSARRLSSTMHMHATAPKILFTHSTQYDIFATHQRPERHEIGVPQGLNSTAVPRRQNHLDSRREKSVAPTTKQARTQETSSGHHMHRSGRADLRDLAPVDTCLTQTFNNCTFNFNGLQPDNFNGALAALLPQFMPANETIFLDDTDDSD